MYIVLLVYMLFYLYACIYVRTSLMSSMASFVYHTTMWKRYHRKSLIPRYKTDESADNLHIDYTNSATR